MKRVVIILVLAMFIACAESLRLSWVVRPPLTPVREFCRNHGAECWYVLVGLVTGLYPFVLGLLSGGRVRYARGMFESVLIVTLGYAAGMALGEFFLAAPRDDFLTGIAMSFVVAFLPGLVVGLIAFSGAASIVNLTRKGKQSDDTLQQTTPHSDG